MLIGTFFSYSATSHHPSPITHHPSPITHHPSPITHHPSPITHHPSPIYLTHHYQQLLLSFYFVFTSSNNSSSPHSHNTRVSHWRSKLVLGSPQIQPPIAYLPYSRSSQCSPLTHNRYTGQQLGANPPHLFAIAEDAYSSLRLHDRDQSILISGESGYVIILASFYCTPLTCSFFSFLFTLSFADLNFFTDRERQRLPSWSCNTLLLWRERY
jgi:hypothetical protein